MAPLVRQRRSSIALLDASGPAAPGRRLALAGATLLALLVVLMPLARGGVDRWAEAAAAVLGIGALLLVAARGASVPASALALTAVTGVVLLQLVPVPPFLHRLSPGAVRIFEISLSPLGRYPALRPLSLDPAATARQLAKAVAGLAAFVAAFAVAEGHRRRHRVLLGLGLSGVATAAAVLGLALAGAGPFVAPRFPFVNRNHLAALENLSALVALGLALRARGQARLLWLLGVAAAGAVSILTLSRGGFLALFLGAALFVTLHLRAAPAERGAASPRRLALAAGALVAALGVASYLALDPLVGKLATLRSGADDARLHLWRPALQVLRDFPVVGVGRGAFSDVFAGYQLDSTGYQFTHVENEWLQPLLDLGIPAGLLLIGTFAWVWVAAARRRALSDDEIGLLAGTAAVALQGAVDFSLEFLGVGIPFAVAMGLLARGQRAVSPRPGALRAGAAALALVAAGGLAVGYRHGGGVDQARVESAHGGPATAAVARAVAAWHPADWVPHALAGVRLSAERRCAEAMPWLLRAMALYPSAPAPHLGAARCLAGRDDPAARREYRLAIAFGLDALPEAAARYPDLGALLEIAPDTPEGLLSLGGVLERGRPADAATVFARVLDEFAEERALLPLARLRAAAGRDDDAIALARRHEQRFRSDPAGYALAAASLSRLGREDEARAELERGLAAAPGSPALLEVLAGQAMAARRWSEAKRLAEEIAPRTADEVAAKHLLAARALLGQGRLSEAIDRVRSAQSARPDSVGVLVELARLLEQAGRLEEALDVMRHAAALPGVPPGAYASRIAALEAERAARLQHEAERGPGPVGDFGLR